MWTVSGRQDRAIYRRAAQLQGSSGYENRLHDGERIRGFDAAPGGVDHLCEFCADRHSDDDMCPVAEVTIQELIAGSGIFYAASVLSSSSDANPVHDYGMDLQRIHVKAGEWRKVASCWNDRYNHALRAQDHPQMLLDPNPANLTQKAWLTPVNSQS